MNLHTVLAFIGLVCFALSALGVSFRGFNFLAAGVGIWFYLAMFH